MKNYFLSLEEVPKRKKFNVKGSISVHRNNKDYSSTYNTPSISCRLHAVYYFDILYSKWTKQRFRYQVKLTSNDFQTEALLS